MTISIDQIKPGDRLSGLIVGLYVTISHVEWHSDNAVNVIYKDDNGARGERILFREELHGISYVEQKSRFLFEGDLNGLKSEVEVIRKPMEKAQERRFQPGTVKESAVERLKHTSLYEDFGFLLTRSRALWVGRDNAAFVNFGLRGRSYSVLALAASGQNPTQRELADFLVLDASQIVAVIDGLEKQGYVERQRSPTDRRTNIIVATESGRKLHNEARAAARESERESGPELSDEERAQLLELLQRIAF